MIAQYGQRLHAQPHQVARVLSTFLDGVLLRLRGTIADAKYFLCIYERLILMVSL